MHLNTISGRTYNDVTQYPVFPWILTTLAYEGIVAEKYFFIFFFLYFFLKLNKNNNNYNNKVKIMMKIIME